MKNWEEPRPGLQSQTPAKIRVEGFGNIAFFVVTKC